MEAISLSIPLEQSNNNNISVSDAGVSAEEVKNELLSELLESGPLKKRLKSETSATKEKLEQRLGGILCCAVCLDLPKTAVYQCTNGHLMCAGCFAHLLADARLRDETASCPNCRCVISKDLCSRNLAVEKAVCELPGQCKHCSQELPRSLLEKHEDEMCDERIVMCRFARIGCPWRGPNHELGINITF